MAFTNCELYKGDCLEILHGIPNKSIDLVITDPPYMLKNHGGGGAFGTRQIYKDIKGLSNGFNTHILDELVRVMKKINIYIFCSKYQIKGLIDYFETSKNCNWNLLTWHKTNPVPSCNNKYLNDTEYIFFAREKGVKIQGQYKSKKTYFVTPTNVKESRLYNHPTVKPQGILDNFIINSSNENDVVLDLFMGSGSTGVSALKLNRKFVGIEINKNYFETAKNRLNEIEEFNEQ